MAPVHGPPGRLAGGLFSRAEISLPQEHDQMELFDK
jgi:hypothetical protein